MYITGEEFAGIEDSGTKNRNKLSETMKTSQPYKRAQVLDPCRINIKSH